MVRNVMSSSYRYLAFMHGALAKQLIIGDFKVTTSVRRSPLGRKNRGSRFHNGILLGYDRPF